jgi:hypothetical protein
VTATNPGVRFFPSEQQMSEDLGAFQRAEIDKWWPIIKKAE